MRGEFKAGNTLSFNSGSGEVKFNPTIVEAKQLNSNFLKKNISINSNDYINLSNLNEIYIDGNQFIPENINLNSTTDIDLRQTTVSGDVYMQSGRTVDIKNVTANNIIINDEILDLTNVKTINDLLIDSSESLGISGNIEAGNLLKLNGGKHSTWFYPESIKAKKLELNFLKLSDEGNLSIDNVNHIGISIPEVFEINGKPLNIQNINISGKSVNLLLYSDISGNIDVNAEEDVHFGTWSNTVIRGDINLTSNEYLSIYTCGPCSISSLGNINLKALEKISLTGWLWIWPLLNAKNITVESSNNIEFHYASLVAGSNNEILVNQDGSINPSSTIGASINNNIINVNDVLLPAPNGIINITGNIEGVGRLQANGTNSDVEIRNTSGYDLKLNNIITSNTKQPGQIIINGNSVTNDFDYIKVMIGQGSGSGLIDINNKSASNVLIAGNISGNTVNISNPLGDIVKTGSLISANDVNLRANNITNFLPLDVSNSTTINTTNNAYISGKTGNLTANTGGIFEYNNINANNLELNAGGRSVLYTGSIGGNVNIYSTAPAADGPAEVNLGYSNTDLAIGGNLNATATQGNIYYYGGSVGGNASFTSGESFDNRVSTGLGRYRPLNISGNTTVNAAGNFTYTYGNVGGNLDLIAGKLAGILDVDIMGNLTVDALAFGYFGGTAGGNINVTAPAGSILGAGEELAVAGNVDIFSTQGTVGLFNSQIAGNLNINAFEAINNENITFDYNGNTYDLNDLPYPVNINDTGLLIGGNLDITGDNLVSMESGLTGNFNAQVNGDLYFTDNLGNFNADRIESTNGSIYINVPEGSAVIDYISAPGTISVTAADNIFIDTIDPNEILLSADMVNINKAFADNIVDIRSNYIYGSFYNNSNSPINFSLSGANNNKAQNIYLGITSTSGSVVNSLQSVNATLNVILPDTELTILNCNVDTLTINEPRNDISYNIEAIKIPEINQFEVATESGISEDISNTNNFVDGILDSFLNPVQDEIIIDSSLDAEVYNINYSDYYQDEESQGIIFE